MVPDQPGALSGAIPHGALLRAVEDDAPTSKTSTDFLWVGPDEDPQDRTAARAKQAFIRTRYHRRKKETQLQNLKSSVKPFPTENRLVRSQEALVPVAYTPVLGQATNLDVLDGVLSLSLRTDQNTNLYFHHFKFYASKAYLPLYSDGLKMSLLQMAFAEPATLKTFLSIAAFHRAIGLSLRDASPQTVQKSVQDGLQLRGEAIKSLRQVIGRPSYRYSEAILMAMVHLLYIEGAEGNVEAVDAHMKGLKRMIEAQGGIDKLGYRAETLVYW
ncbi:hypothetical protein N7474_000875 [Penicillium riverlandense]|uniref:uncharacterized protein n=1 Tax=Penicillium riverlandense TaxID=1903569 RepID=UPI0025484B8C|nr:uncharacterized protein N7474_000875 [Penicillium riverlandense]KAJ5832564.1 hypothetical protein N7474_000875 [Penicillium riverlandense]